VEDLAPLALGEYLALIQRTGEEHEFVQTQQCRERSIARVLFVGSLRQRSDRGTRRYWLDFPTTPRQSSIVKQRELACTTV
jgi:hypothetical protein